MEINNLIWIWKIFLVTLCSWNNVFGFQNQENEVRRPKRGASVYPVFPQSPGSGYNAYPQVLDMSFAEYLGGNSGGRSSRYSNAMDPFDQNALPSFNSPPITVTQVQTKPSSGWESIVPYSRISKGFYLPYYGHTTPTFANNNGNTASAPRPYVPQLSATALLNSAQSSSYSQKQLFNALTEKSQVNPYKGGLF